MNRKTYLTVTAVAASLALPATAPAATANSSASVRADVKASVQAFEKVQALTEAGRDGAAAAKLRLGLRELRAAARTTARMRLKANGNRAHLRVVRAERMIGECADVGANALAEVVGDANASVEVDMASAISSLLAIEQQAIDALRATVEVGSGVVDAAAVKAIAALSASTAGVVSAISGAIASGDVSADATLKLDAALELATETVTSSLATLKTISVAVAGTAHGSVTAAISAVTGALAQAQATLQALAGTVAATGTGAVASIVLPTLNGLRCSVSQALSAEAHVQVGAKAGVTAG